MCNDCHNHWADNDFEVKDCHGIDCPLGMPHPPPCKDPKKGGVFPLGCGICRSEKLDLLERNRAVQQVIDVDNLPEAYIYKQHNYIDNYEDEMDEYDPIEDEYDDYYD